jgi:serine/threonine-protein kinase HipA
LVFEGSGRVRQGRFIYAKTWLANPNRSAIDPIGLPLRRGSVTGAPNDVPIVFYDAGPDGWGKEILTAAFPTRHLGMAEFLALGSLQRTGDLAFGPDPDGPATWMPPELPLLSLPVDTDSLEDLVTAAAAMEAGQATEHHLQTLFRSSADVGGARPKARLRHNGIEWIAKFPSWGDAFDDPRMEAVCLDLAAAAGVPVPERALRMIGSKTVLLVRRFDRTGHGARHGYLSAATLLKHPANAYNTDRTYVDIAVAARAIGVTGPEAGIYRRLLVNAFLHNTDDHLRNMAFLNVGGDWQISPAFDLVPHKMARHVCAPTPALSPENDPGVAAAAYTAFGLRAAEARAVFDEVVDGMQRVREMLEFREVSAKDRQTVEPLLKACLSPPAWTEAGKRS